MARVTKAELELQVLSLEAELARHCACVPGEECLYHAEQRVGDEAGRQLMKDLNKAFGCKETVIEAQWSIVEARQAYYKTVAERYAPLNRQLGRLLRGVDA
jgi:hypothetical protein